jgi:nitroreductase
MSKLAKTDHPIHELIARRWSPYGFDGRGVDDEDLTALLEAARWAASSYNEQPWRFIVARKSDEALYRKVLGCLVEANQQWAKQAPVLILTAISRSFARNGKPNKAAEHDLGLAAGNLSLEATKRGLSVHQMIGIEPEKVREAFAVPEGYDPLTGIAIGYAADPATLPDDLKKRDTTPRSRKPLDEIVFGDAWGEASALVRT